MQALNAEDLQAFMHRHAVQAEIVRLPVLTPTVETAALAVGATVEQIVKSILFLVDAQPVLAITCGTPYVNRRSLADWFAVGKKRIKLASAQEVLALSGYEVGAMPPFGHRQPLYSLLDPHVLDHNEVYAGGGADNALLRISPEEILRVSQAQVLDLVTSE